DFWLDPAPGTTVTGDHNSAFHGDAEPVEGLVVFGNAVINVHKRPRPVTVNRVGVVGGELLIVLASGGVPWNGRLLEPGFETLGLQQFERAIFGCGKENLE